MIKTLAPDWPAPANVVSLSTMRSGGVSSGPYGNLSGVDGLNLGDHVGDAPLDVQENRARLSASLPASPVWLNQVHATRVVDAANAQGKPDADASIASETGMVCAIQTADCLPVLFCDTLGSCVGAAHAGWRGLAGGVLEATVAQMRERSAADILVWLGPAIGPTQFEVGSEVHAAFVAKYPRADQAFAPHPQQAGKYFANLYLLARLALEQVGVTAIYGGNYCTYADAARFYSYRRDGVTGRMASLIWLK